MKFLHLKTWAGLAFVLGITLTNGVAAESLAGLGMQYKFVSPANFVTREPGCGQGGQSFYAAGSGCTGLGLGVTQYQAPIDLPEGAQIQRMYAWYLDNSANGNISVFVGRTTMDFAATNRPTSGNTTSNFAGVGFFSGGQPPDANWHMATMTPTSSFTINSWDASGVVPVYQSYSVFVQLASNDASLGFNGALIAYKRQIAPAPATADFTDVPTLHPFFNEVEQLKKSGITLGCGNGQFCPDSPVTRGQMAVFLSRALGLQWNPPV